jgi:translation initiation factor IF-1
MEFEGEIVESNKDLFKVRIFNNSGNSDVIVNCTLSGKIRQNSVRILLGDRVKVIVNEYDTSRGRITFRLK